ncbi:hypothetical protein A7D17_05660 [Xanthomonas floridensis]|uniref:Uncharacterized protein n=1 Tax=Xanthomonas floridensis TaxID=1843580 RepID=A0A1A9M8Q2_9XANT|nr:hypothetical protein A7D17_05660 [Xanthomonas floridensis]
MQDERTIRTAQVGAHDFRHVSRERVERTLSYDLALDQQFKQSTSNTICRNNILICTSKYSWQQLFEILRDFKEYFRIHEPRK